jgi:ribosomal protein S18 acetylase RimI-like enzyme
MTPDTIDSPVGSLRVTAATVEHAPAVRELRNDLARWMLKREIAQWSPGEMSLEWIETCISWGAVHVVTRGEDLVGSVTVVWDDPLVWGRQPPDAGYIHMLMVHPMFRGHGTGRSILGWAEALIRDAGRPLARLDCARTNRALRTYYEDLGYRFVAHKPFPGLEGAGEGTLYQKVLAPDA